MKNKLQNPLFILSVALLLLNDFYLKQALGNAFTGKLSDFAGLFAFPFFFSCLMPNWKKHIHVFTAIVFVWWKSALSQPFIDWVNVVGLPISRVVDFSDNVALLSIAASYFVFSRIIEYRKIKPVLLYSVIFVSCFSFVATSLPPRTALIYTSVDREYRFEKPMEQFILDFNNLQRKEIGKYGGLAINPDFDETKGVYYANGHGDTLTYLINYEMEKDKDTIRAKNYLADFLIYRNEDNSTSLKLVKVATIEKNHKLTDNELHNMWRPDSITKRYSSLFTNNISLDANDIVDEKAIKRRDKAIKAFEKKVVKKLR